MDELQVFMDAGIYDPDADDARDVRNLLLWMIDSGWEADAVIDGARECGLAEFASEIIMRPLPDLTTDEVAEQLDISADDVDQLRRMMGLAPRPHDRPAFTKREAEAFRNLRDAKAMFTMDEANHFARVVGASLARIADAGVSLFLIDVEGPLRARGGTDIDVVELNVQAGHALDAIASALDPMLRMHMDDAIRRSREARQIDGDVNLVRLAVGFVDLVGFTAFSEDATAAELGALVRRFEATAFDLVTENDGRVVKLIGDEVMFVAVDPAAACRAATALVRAFRTEGVTPRGGLAYGDLLTRGGDYYGPLVNVASRIGDLAVPNELLATTEFAAACPGVDFDPAGRRQLKGFTDPIELVSILP